ncbi:unnamed protein product [Brassicogethes aeneus]|uniref:Caspase-8 n=1 Tax=Brassicogethes aeneus TaxID=1431903 RepID=A0A9P0B0Q7_BRAAE|nr:unnamed protein product [Brassicogethes aeneus]
MMEMISNFWANYVMSNNISDNISESGDEDYDEITLDAAVNVPNFVNVSKNIEIKKISNKLDERDVVGIIFLGCDSPERALNILEDGFIKCNMENAILDWTKTESNWQKKLVEALCIIQNFKILHELGFNKNEVINQYLPYHIYVSCDVMIKRKALYFLCENMNSIETSRLIKLVKMDFEANRLNFKLFTQNCYLELYLLHWETLKYDLSKILSNLKSMELSGLQEKLSKVLITMDNINQINSLASTSKDVLTKPTPVKQKLHSNKAVDNSQLISISSIRSEVSSISNIIDEEDKESTYDIDPNNPGLCLIINQEAFYKELDQKYVNLLSLHPFEDRQGTEYDKNKLETTFKSYGFKVVVENNLTHFDLIDTVKKVVKEITVESSIFVCILSHGDKDVVYGTNSCKVAVSEIQRILTKSNKTHLSGKPKVLVLQSCQGKEKQKITVSDDESEDELTTDGDLTTDGPVTVQDTADNLTFWATVPGYAAIRDKKHGTWFIQTLCDEMQRLGHKTHFQDICTSVNNSVTAKKWVDVVMTPLFISTFRKKFYLPPIRK